MPWGRLAERGRLLSQTERGIDLRRSWIDNIENNIKKFNAERWGRGLENLLPLYLNVLMTCSFFQGFYHCLGGLGSNFTILKLSCTVSASFLFAFFFCSLCFGACGFSKKYCEHLDLVVSLLRGWGSYSKV